ncbi:MAG: hypothetical protein KF816_17345 [Melioribacteraceae bacterium]|jgi:hypothetical protein|nr:hypothetical protein [Melioribacteraceae bacterium]
MKKNDFGLHFKLKSITGTSTRFIHSGDLKTKQIGPKNFQPHCNREKFSPALLALTIAAHATHNQSNGKSQATKLISNIFLFLN